MNTEHLGQFGDGFNVVSDDCIVEIAGRILDSRMKPCDDISGRARISRDDKCSVDTQQRSFTDFIVIALKHTFEGLYRNLRTSNQDGCCCSRRPILDASIGSGREPQKNCYKEFGFDAIDIAKRKLGEAQDA